MIIMLFILCCINACIISIVIIADHISIHVKMCSLWNLKDRNNATVSNKSCCNITTNNMTTTNQREKSVLLQTPHWI